MDDDSESERDVEDERIDDNPSTGNEGPSTANDGWQIYFKKADILRMHIPLRLLQIVGQCII